MLINVIYTDFSVSLPFVFVVFFSPKKIKTLQQLKTYAKYSVAVSPAGESAQFKVHLEPQTLQTVCCGPH